MFEVLKLKYQMARMTVAQLMNKFDNDTKAETPVRAMIMLLVLAVLAGALIPTAIDSLAAGKNTSGDWTSSETATYGIIGILIIVAVVLIVVRIATE